MSDPAPVTNFQDFIAKHGEDSLDKMSNPDPEARTSDSGSPSGVTPLSSVPPAPSPAQGSEPQGEGLDGESDPFSLDEATLEALKLQEPKGESPPAGSSDDDTPVSIDLDSVSKNLGFDKDLLSVKEGKVYVKTKVDGDIADKSLADLVKGYQLQEHTTRKSMDLATEREKWEKQVQEQKAAFEQQAQMVYDVLQRDEKEITERYGKMKWDELRIEDPAQYAALVADYNREIAEVKGRQQQVVQSAQQHQAEQQAKMQTQLQELKVRELGALTQKLGWTEESAPEKAKPIQQYLLGAPGYKTEELNQIFDHRFIVLADKARQWDALQGRIKDIKAKKVDPKHPVPAGSVSSQGSKASTTAKRRTAQERLAKTGDVKDAAEVFKNIPGLLD